MTRLSLSLAVLFVVACSGGEKPIYLSCYDSADKLPGEAGTKFTVECPQLCTSGSVWGSETYTSDSKVCKAAIHAGALKPQGGKTKVIIKGGEKSYKGSSKNGINSSDYGAWSRSFVFD
jgi:hypothetical protein